MFVFFFNDTATTEIYTLSLHDALPIWWIYFLPSDRWRTSSLTCSIGEIQLHTCLRSTVVPATTIAFCVDCVFEFHCWARTNYAPASLKISGKETSTSLSYVASAQRRCCLYRHWSYYAEGGGFGASHRIRRMAAEGGSKGN